MRKVTIQTAKDAVSVGEQEDTQVSEVCREADGKITDKVKKIIIEAFKEYPCLCNTCPTENTRTR